MIEVELVRSNQAAQRLIQANKPTMTSAVPISTRHGHFERGEVDPSGPSSQRSHRCCWLPELLGQPFLLLLQL